MPVATKIFRCEALLTRQGWLANASIAADDKGIIRQVWGGSIVAAAHSALPVTEIKGAIIPGFQNAHSHAFQYAMAGLAEHLPANAPSDDFWSWRQAMYKLAGAITPDEHEDIAAMLYAEMLRHGYTAVAEFHYLHHDVSGQPYTERAEMSQRLMAAAERSGIHLTLIPIFYQKGGFGVPARPEQKRFISATATDYDYLHSEIYKVAQSYEGVNVGVGFHSLRAVATSDLLQVLASKPKGPIHIHVAEQQQEVDQAISHLRKRPVEWLLDHADLSSQFNLVHATHMNASETARLASSGAVVVVCPSTEGNLGDGFFPIQEYAALGGRYAIGTDSHIGLSAFEELRWLDYGQRLRSQRRNTLCREASDDSGMKLLDSAWTAGRLAMGQEANEYFAPGQSFDAICLDLDHPILVGKPMARWISTAIYAGESTLIKGVLRRGEWVVEQGKHTKIEDISRRFRHSMRSLSKV